MPHIKSWWKPINRKMTRSKWRLPFRPASDCTCLLFVDHSTLRLCSTTRPSSFCTSSGAVHQAVWKMQFKCKFLATDKDLLKASGWHQFTKQIFVRAHKYGRQWFCTNLYSNSVTAPSICTALINKKVYSKIAGSCSTRKCIQLPKQNIWKWWNV